ncbi:phage protein [Streptococcus pneumoniae]|uniref:phage tail tube protein n=1 Tax=Streptococcus pneumoniae TaxID=1313 RepID=UPI0005E621EF|nr:hypothetical protein [Streptococcus pneumoniae]CAG7568856.1 phage protein [Streptococcus pneumoniae]CEV40758.1 phage protein [Streptococcus pneumoniae]CEV84688.1 phage protein [Streptococcus pneumoniae]CEY70499.1 phage protein [Streptococcus pneumoniae]CGG49730.1 phage protein [Streptococcus pneumoniae]
MSFLLNHLYKFDIGTEGTGETTKWANLSAGITSVDPDNNEESEQTYYYNGGGMATNDITGLMLGYSFSGHRDYADPAQNFIYSKAHLTGDARKAPFRVTEPDGTMYTGMATISGIKAPGGDANAKGEIEFTISFDGVPEYKKAPVSGGTVNIDK